MKPLARFEGWVYIIVAACLYAMLPILVKAGYSIGLDPGRTLLLRYAFTMVLLFIATMVMGQKRPLLWSPSVLTQGIVFIGSGILYFIALQSLSAGLTTVIFFTHPVIVAVLAIVVFGEKFDPFLFAGICLVVIGITLISEVGNFSAINVRGMVLALFSSVGYGLYTLIGQHTLNKHQPLSIAFTISVISVFTLAAIFHEQIASLIHITWQQLGLTLAMAFFINLGAVVLFLKGLETIGASRATLMGSLEPLFTLLMAYAVLGERFDNLEMWGSGLVLAGMFLAVLRSGVKQRLD